MTRRFSANVWVTDSAGNQVFYEMGAPVPDGLPVGDHVYAEVNDDYLGDTAETMPGRVPAPVADADPTSAANDFREPETDEEQPTLTPPPVSGPGATKAAWMDYFEASTGRRIGRAWIREDIIQACRDAGLAV